MLCEQGVQGFTKAGRAVQGATCRMEALRVGQTVRAFMSQGNFFCLSAKGLQEGLALDFCQSTIPNRTSLHTL